MNAPIILVSHALCPYVQRAAIVLTEKSVPFARRDVDLSNKPEWFLDISPLSKTPVLLVGDAAIFESAVICEYLDEAVPPRLHPDDALLRAQHRSWMEFGSALLSLISAFYRADTEEHLHARAADIHAQFVRVEAGLGTGPYFSGANFSIVDAVFGPIFRYFDLFDSIDEFGFWDGVPKVCSWRCALAQRPSVAAAVRPDYPALLRTFLRARGSALSRRMKETSGRQVRILPIHEPEVPSAHI
ncbi:glutathione S-transferase family protein [Zoogloea sp.]|uniref:glutathione S-transferase family protein n=1 Tax=Zoogloea sp. TaxID=49181 RepID=UPI0035B48483